MTRRRTVLFAATATAAVALAGCTSSGSDAKSSAPTAPPSSSIVATTVPTESLPAPSTTPSKTRSSSSPSKSPSTSKRSPSPVTPIAPPFITTCTKLTTRVIPGGAIRGAEIAAVQYTNDGTTTCRISGYPRLVLLRNGKKVGTPSQPSGKKVKLLTLKPGDVGEALVRDFSTCNAPLADNGRVTVPGREQGDETTVVRPVKLRACLLRIDPVGPPA